jgi:hypothetical protein
MSSVPSRAARRLPRRLFPATVRTHLCGAWVAAALVSQTLARIYREWRSANDALLYVWVGLLVQSHVCRAQENDKIFFAVVQWVSVDVVDMLRSK